VLRRIETELELWFVIAKSIFPSLLRSPIATVFGLVAVVLVACVANVVLDVAIPKFGTERLSIMIEVLAESEPSLVLVLLHDCTKATIG
jgi:hypothetical protein